MQGWDQTRPVGGPEMRPCGRVQQEEGQVLGEEAEEYRCCSIGEQEISNDFLR